jgi:hypothetical protein
MRMHTHVYTPMHAHTFLPLSVSLSLPRSLARSVRDKLGGATQLIDKTFDLFKTVVAIGDDVIATTDQKMARYRAAVAELELVRVLLCVRGLMCARLSASLRTGCVCVTVC